MVRRRFDRFPEAVRARRSRFKGFTAVSFHLLKCERPRSTVDAIPVVGRRFGHLAICSSFFASKCRHRDLDRPQMGDLRHRFTELSHEICAHRHSSGTENWPEFSGRFKRPQVISLFAPFPYVPGGNIPWKTGVFGSHWVFLTPRMFDFKGADSGFRKNFLLFRIDDHWLKHESFRMRRG